MPSESLVGVWTLHKDSAVTLAFSKHFPADVVKAYSFPCNDTHQQ